MINRLIVRGQVLSPIPLSSLTEAEYQRAIVQNFSTLFRQYEVVPFARTIESAAGSRRADFAAVAKDYRDWWVIEVERVTHSLEDHVIPQVDVFLNATYGHEDAAYLRRKQALFDERALVSMMKGAPPQVFVVVNEDRPRWDVELRRRGAQYLVFEVFRSDRNEYAFRIDGDIPMGAEATITECRADELLPRWLKVISPASLSLAAPEEQMELFIDGQASTWRRVETGSKVYLVPEGPYSLPRSSRYELSRDTSGSLVLRASRSPRTWR